MSAEALNRIIKEVETLTPDERRQLIEKLAHEEQLSEEQHKPRSGSFKETEKEMAPDFDDSTLSQLNTHDEGSPGHSATLREWLNETRSMRTKLPLTSDSVNLLRELREARFKQ